MNLLALLDPLKCTIKSLLGLPSIKEHLAGEFLKEAPALFDKAKNEVLISTACRKEFYEDERIKDALTKAIKRGVRKDIVG